MRRLVTAGLLPERAGQPVKAWVHISLADLMVLEGSSALLEEWTARVRALWAGHRAQASAGGSDGGAWLDGAAAEAVACDAAMAPFVTGEVNPAALEDLLRLCVQLDRFRHHPGSDDGGQHDPGSGDDGGRTGTGGTGSDGQGAPGPHTARPRGRPWSARSSAGRSISCPARAGWRRSCGAGSSAPGWAGRACRWTSASARPSRPGSATRSPCVTSIAGGPAAAASPRRPARCTMSGTRPTAARPALEIVFYFAGFTTRL